MIIYNIFIYNKLIYFIYKMIKIDKVLKHVY